MVIVYEFYGVFVVENLTTTLTLKMKKIGLLGANKRSKTLAGHELGKNCSKSSFGETSCL